MVLVYNLILAVSIVIFQSRVPNWPLNLAFNLSIVAFVLCLSNGPIDPPGIIMKIIRRWYFLILLLFIYQQTGGLVFLYVPHWLDNGLAMLEYNIFGVHPTLYLQKFNLPILNEYFMFGYLTYFLLILSFAAILIYRKMYYQMDRYITTVSMVFLVCFFTFYLFPIAGPRFLFQGVYDGPLTGGIFVPMVNYVIQKGAAEGGSMPSSHTAAAIVVLVHSWRYVRPAGYIYAPIIFGLVIGTFWGRFHYVSDTIVGFFVAIMCIMITDWLIGKRKFGSKNIKELSSKEYHQTIAVSK